jgi:hypothetical protein
VGERRTIRLEVGHCSHEELVEALATVPGLKSWADDFERRYLNLAPVR